MEFGCELVDEIWREATIRRSHETFMGDHMYLAGVKMVEISEALYTLFAS